MKKKIPRFRFLSFLMVLVLLLGITTPCYAESTVDTSINHGGNIYDTGTLVYNYDRIPANMKYNWGMASRGLEFVMNAKNAEKANAFSAFLVRVSRFELEAS